MTRTHVNRAPLTADEQARMESELTLALTALALLGASRLLEHYRIVGNGVSGLLTLAALITSAAPVVARALKGLFAPSLQAGTEMLVTLAVAASFLSGARVTAVLIPVLLTAVHFFEERSILGGREALEGLKNLKAKTALKLVDGEEIAVDASRLRPGDRAVVKPGMTLPADGQILEGLSHLDEKSLTGESLPREVGPGDQAWAGTVNLDGRLVLKVEKTADQTSFAKILALLDNAQDVNLPELALVDRFLAFYIPFSLAAAALTGLFSQDVSRAVSLLVVCCPCGQLLVSSAPMVAALSEATRRGILIKAGPFLQKLTNVDAVAFDKTGTLTRGELALLNVKAEQGTEEETLLWGARATAGSLHPVARALQNLCPTTADGWAFTEYPGRGCRITKDNLEVLCGNQTWLQGLGYTLPCPAAQGPQNLVVKDGIWLGTLTFGDSLRSEAPQAVARLKNLGLKRAVLLTGDRAATAADIARRCGLDDYAAGLLPEHKVAKLRELQQTCKVMVVGDGVNDVPALKEAYVGVAMGAMGSDAAVETADVALINNDLTNLPRAVELARSTRAVIGQNIALTFGISFTLIVLSAAGVLSPLVAALSHNLGAFAVLANSSRLLGCTEDDRAERQPDEPAAPETDQGEPRADGTDGPDEVLPPAPHSSQKEKPIARWKKHLKPLAKGLHK